MPPNFEDAVIAALSEAEIDLATIGYDRAVRFALSLYKRVGLGVGTDGCIHNPAPRDDRGSYNYPEQRFRTKTYPRRR
jgi:hypothetical protein